MNTQNQTPTPSPSDLDPQKVRNDLEAMLRQAAQQQGKTPADKPAGK